MKIKNYKYGFALTELLVSVAIMAVLSLLVVFAIAKKTQKTLSTPSSGRIICYKDMNGNLRQKTELKQRNGSTDVKEEASSKCKFEIPANARNITVYVIGAGGGGATSPTVSEKDGCGVTIDVSGAIYTSYKPIQTWAINFQDLNTNPYSDNYLTDGTLCVTTESDGTTKTNQVISENSKEVPSGRIKQVNCNGTMVDMPTKTNKFYYPYTKLSERCYSYCQVGNVSIANKAQTIDEIYENSDMKKYFTKEAVLADIFEAFGRTGCTGIRMNVYGTIKDPLILNGNGNKIPNGTTTYALHVPTKSYACYGGNLIRKADDSTYYNKLGYQDDKHPENRLFYTEIRKVTGLNNVPVGYPGENGTVKIIRDAKALAGRTITVKPDSIGTGGKPGSKGGDTTFEDSFIETQVAQGGAPGLENHLSLGVKCTGGESPLEKKDFLTSDRRFPKNRLASYSGVFDKRKESAYYDDTDNSQGIIDFNEIIIPNSVCVSEENKNGKETCEPTVFDEKKNNLYNANYGGGGGGYNPGIEYGCVAEASINYYDKKSGKMVKTVYWDKDTNFEDTSQSPTQLKPICHIGKSTSGMGGAIIIKWDSL